MWRGSLISAVLFLTTALPTAAAISDPVLWPEEQRAFLEGPGLLLTPVQRQAFLDLDEAGRTAYIEEFLDRDPIPATPQNELREGIERRRRLMTQELWSPQDVRPRLLFLRGSPVERLVVDCGAVFKPMELWRYGPAVNPIDLVLYQATTREHFRLWVPIDAKASIYTPDMANWLEQWQQMGVGGKRIDRRFCPTSERVDAATGIDGLQGYVIASFGSGFTHPGGEKSGRKEIRRLTPRDRSSFLAPPAELADWAREAAATPRIEESQALTVEAYDMDFPIRTGQRLVARSLVALRADEALAATEVDGKSEVRLVVEGLVEEGDQVFETFRVRFRLPPPAGREPVPLLFETPLRPGQTFLLRLRVRNEGTGAQAELTRGFRVPAKTETKLAAGAVAAATRGELASLLPGTGKDRLILLPALGEVMIGTWRAEVLVSGPRITRVTYLVDGESQMTRTSPPYSAELRLAAFPREQVVRAEGYDDDGALVAADETVLNQARGTFRIRIAEPERGARIQRASKVTARAEVVVPEEQKVQKVEFLVNDVTVATFDAPPWQAEVRVPDEEIVHLTAVAWLEDGTRVEDLRFLRAPQNLEELDVNVVELYVTVTDSSSHVVRGLRQEDFQVLESGKPQALSRFELVENLPLTLGFALDTSISMASSLVEAERAATGFLQGIMRPRDRAFAVGFSQFSYLVMPPTDDVDLLSDALAGLRANGRSAVYDGILTGLYYLRSTQGQRALVVLTDGDDNASSTPWKNVLEYARRSGVTIFPVGLNIGNLAVEVRTKFSELAEATGGKVFYISRAEDLTGVYDEIEQELRSRYFLAFNSERPADDLGFRAVEVKVKRGLRARTARGYYP